MSSLLVWVECRGVIGVWTCLRYRVNSFVERSMCSSVLWDEELVLTMIHRCWDRGTLPAGFELSGWRGVFEILRFWLWLLIVLYEALDIWNLKTVVIWYRTPYSNTAYTGSNQKARPRYSRALHELSHPFLKSTTHSSCRLKLLHQSN